MFFFIGMLILVISFISVVYKILTGYAVVTWHTKTALLLFLSVAWFAPVWLRWLRHSPDIFDGMVYDCLYKIGYFLMGFVLILSLLLIARDIIWQVLYFIIKKPVLNPDNAHYINVLNMATIVLALMVSFYGVYEAHKTPQVKTLTISNQRIKKPVKIAAASDFHINHSTPVWHINKMIDVINAQNPDYIVLVGDIVDDTPDLALRKFLTLLKLKAKKVYISLGNHEYYNRPYGWMIEFVNSGFEVLHNSGERIEGTGLYLAGIPDVNSAKVNYDRTFKMAEDEDYKILLSHSPDNFKKTDKSKFDLQLSGHTHGGQIFPFQYITKQANEGYLSGLYHAEGTKLYVMKGAGYWGPPMRLFAQPDILVLNLEPMK